MPQPPQYNRLYNLTEYATANPSSPYDAAKVDAELNAVEASFYQALINLALIQRDDGALKNNIVTLDSLNSAVSALMTANESTIRGAWVTATAYAVKDVVTQGGTTYICATAHTSGTFATDLAAVKWLALNSGSTVAATAVSFTPAGGVAAVTAQAAIEEVDSEKLAKASNLSDLASRATAFTNLVAGGGTMTGALTFSGARVNEAQGANVASASTIDLDAATGNLVDVTGTTTITAITLSQGLEAVVRFTGVLTLTHGASLVLPGAASITTSAGDFATFRGYSGGVVRCTGYSKASGVAITAETFGAQCVQNPVAGAATVTTQAHGLSRKPDQVIYWLECITAELGYSVGDRTQTGNSIWLAVSWDATNVKILNSFAASPSVIRKDTAVNANITLANWKVVAQPLLKTTTF